MQLQDFLSASAARFPGKPAVVAGAGGPRISYAELEVRSNRLAWALKDAGVGYGDRVGIFLENGIDCAIAVFAALKADAVFVVMSPSTKPDKLAFMLNDCSARALVVGAQFAEAITVAEAEVASICCIAMSGPAPVAAQSGGKRRISLAGDLASWPASAPPRRGIDMDLAALIYTSGSTGQPKGVAVTHLNMISAATSITTYLESRADDVVLNVLPLSFDYGLYQLLMCMRMGATLVLENSFAYPYRIVEAVARERITGFPGVPTLFALLLQMQDVPPELFDGVRYVTNTAAALPPAHILRLRQLFRKARIYSMYGITECKRVSYLPPEELERRPTSVGRGMPNEQVWVVGEDGRPVRPGEIGELVVRGSNVMACYWNRPDETARALRPGPHPWERVLYTGDLFKTDEDGYLYFVSRKDDIIKSRGEKVSPREVENVLYELPEVREAAVVGAPDPVLGEAVVAYVALAEGMAIDEKQVIAHCAKRLENFMVPRKVVFRPSLPKTASGKIKKTELKAEASGQRLEPTAAATEEGV